MLAISVITYAVVGILLSQIIKFVFQLLIANKDLVNTIEQILRMFPDAIVVRKYEGKELITKFINDKAQKVVSLQSLSLNNEDDE